MSERIQNVFRRMLGLAEKFKGYFHMGPFRRRKAVAFQIGNYEWESRCKYYDDLYEQQSLAKYSVDTVAGHLAKEIFLEATDDTPEAQKALEACKELNRRIKLPILVYNTAFNMGKYGSAFWEKSLNPIFDVRMIPDQHLVAPYKIDEQGNITSWRYSDISRDGAIWTRDMIIPFHRNISKNSWPYGLSMYVGLDTEFRILAKLEDNAEAYTEKQAWPYEVLAVKGSKEGGASPSDTDLDSIKREWYNRQIGDGIVTNYDANILKGGTGGQPLQAVHELMDFVKNNIIDGTGVPPISKQWSSTEASAKEMMPWCRATVIEPMQRTIAFKIEDEVYKPYLETLEINVKLCPTVKWQSPDKDFNERADILMGLVQTGVLPANYAAEELGFDIEKIKHYREAATLRKVAPQLTAKPEKKPLETEPNGLLEMFRKYERS